MNQECNNCNFSVRGGAGPSRVLCRRFPRIVAKLASDWCGEWGEGLATWNHRQREVGLADPPPENDPDTQEAVEAEE